MRQESSRQGSQAFDHLKSLGQMIGRCSSTEFVSHMLHMLGWVCQVGWLIDPRFALANSLDRTGGDLPRDSVFWSREPMSFSDEQD